MGGTKIGGIFNKAIIRLPRQNPPKFIMALFIPHRCPKCFESVTLIQPQDKAETLT